MNHSLYYSVEVRLTVNKCNHIRPIRRHRHKKSCGSKYTKIRGVCHDQIKYTCGYTSPHQNPFSAKSAEKLVNIEMLVKYETFYMSLIRPRIRTPNKAAIMYVELSMVKYILLSQIKLN